jgi:hypothetical protein
VLTSYIHHGLTVFPAYRNDDGAYGPVIIKPLGGNPKPFHMISTDIHLLEEAEAQVKPLLLSDWRHRPSVPTWNDEVASGIATAECMDSLLVNGKGRVDCWPRAEIDAFINPASRRFSRPTACSSQIKGTSHTYFFMQ